MEQVLSRKHICLLEAAAAVDRLRAQASGGQGGTGSQASSKSASEPLTRSEQAKQAHRARRDGHRLTHFRTVPFRME